MAAASGWANGEAAIEAAFYRLNQEGFIRCAKSVDNIVIRDRPWGGAERWSGDVGQVSLALDGQPVTLTKRDKLESRQA